MREHLADLHEKYFNEPESFGHKSNEGYIGLLYRLPNWFEVGSKQEYIDATPKLSMIEVYSYLFGPSRLHQFETVDEAFREVMSWTY